MHLTMRSSHRRISSGALALLLALGLSACSKDEAGGTSGPAKIEGIPKVEVERAQKACNAYAERVCSCAETNPDFVKTCALAKASPGALQVNLELLASKGLEVAEQKAVKVEARKIAAVCFQSDAKLDVAVCPRKTP